ncbi:receptor-like protein EIX2 [Typha angustifolia]|uniref:receptor-like protein EIX2 n=1 Tax=Typha angustifolia TaxID=59011 RepID=UPI003C2E23E2
MANRVVILMVWLLLLISPSLSLKAVGSCIPQERDALLSFKTGIKYTRELLPSWKGQDCCQWWGVTCSNLTGNVVKLDLHNMCNLQVDDGYYGNPTLGGDISPSLSALKNLRYLDLSSNNFGGQRIPEFMGSFKNLRYLNLSFAGFSGSIPPQLGNLSKLLYLDLAENTLQSVDLVAWLPRLSFLRHLDMAGVDLSVVVINWVQPLSMLPSSLRVLLLSGCNLNTTLSSLFNSSSTLVSVDLSHNWLHGPLPNGLLGNMTSIEQLLLVNNDLSGVIPRTLKNLRNLDELDLSWNDLSMIQSLSMLPSSLRVLDLSNCNINTTLSFFLKYSSNFTSLVSLDLSHNFLYGPLPNGLLGNMTSLEQLLLGSNDLSGVIPGTLKNLRNLDELDLSWNNLSMVQSLIMLPSSLRTLDLSICNINTTLSFLLKYSSNFTSLVSLDLSINLLHGSIPDGQLLGNMTFLEQLLLGDNDLSSVIPRTLKNLHNLKFLDLSYNQFNGELAELMERLPNKVQSLFLSENNFTGSLASCIAHMSSLRVLDLSDNNLVGSIPLGMGKLSNLSELDLSSNHLDGIIIEDHFASLIKLKYIYLANNYLTIVLDPNWIPPFKLEVADFGSCKLGPHFPAWIQGQTDITFLNMSSAEIADKLPDWFWHVMPQLTYLDLSHNQISGVLPMSLEFMSAASSINLRSNRLEGGVPKLPASLYSLDLSRNYLSGSLPPNLGNVQLDELFLSNNLISGPIPSCMCNQLQSLQLLDLSNNHLLGELPQCWTSGKSSKANHNNLKPVSSQLSVISFSNNNLSGEFPLFTLGCPQLTFLDLSYNNFFGNLPTRIAKRLPMLAFLLLRSNMFSGHIPIQLSKLNNLQVLDLSHNNLSGTIAPSLLNLPAMTIISQSVESNFRSAIEFDGNYRINPFFGLSVTMKGQTLEYYTEIRLLMVSLDLSGNYLTGEIPEEIGALARLINLNLSRNQLIGNIPETIGGLLSLESLDLSNNELSGQIPSNLSALTSLVYLNLSYNNLSGRIPTGHQLQTLNDSSIYEGNVNLCGPPVSKDCSGNDTILDALPEYKDEDDMSSFYLSMGLGFATGFWLVFGPLLLKSTWRTAYFIFIDNTYDKIYVFMVLNWARLFARIKKK